MSEVTLTLLSGAGLLLGLLLVLLLLRPRRRVRKAAKPAGKDRPAILVDGSNVMHWQDNSPQLAPLRKVLARLQSLGFAPGVVFDANAGWKLAGRFLSARDLARMLSLPADQVLVVPKGTQADWYLLETAGDLDARIVTNDRFRDWADSYPRVTEAGFLIRGGIENGKVWLQDVNPAAPPKAVNVS
jgi:hypothetical protein